LTILVTGLVLGYSGWLFLRGDDIFYDYLFGAYGLHTFIWQSSLGLSAWYQAFLASPPAYYLLVGGAAVTVGVIMFTLLQVVGVLRNGTRHLLQEAGSNEPEHKRAAHELLLRLGTRVLGMVGWAGFAAFFVSSILPFTIVLNQTGIHYWADGGRRLIGFGASLAAVLLFAVALHLQVVFARLSFLRSRLFHASSAVEEAEAASHTI